METSLESPPGGTEEEHYQTLGYGGDVIEISTRDWYLVLYSNSSFTGGQNTYTHINGSLLIFFAATPTTKLNKLKKAGNVSLVVLSNTKNASGPAKPGQKGLKISSERGLRLLA